MNNKNDQCLTYHGLHGECTSITPCSVLQNGLNLRSDLVSYLSTHFFQDRLLFRGSTSLKEMFLIYFIFQISFNVTSFPPNMTPFLIFALLQLTHLIDGRTIFPTNVQNENDSCVSNNGVQGKCILITSCNVLLKHLNQRENHPKICSWDRHYPIVCCPDFDPRTDATDFTTNNPKPVIGTARESNGDLKRSVNCGIKPLIPLLYVVGGNEAKSAFEWPWMAALFTKSLNARSSSSKNKNFSHFCGGTIISESCILTAAHCVFSFIGTRISELFIGVGSNDLETTIKYSIQKIIIHPSYVSRKSYHDIALLMTSRPINFTESMTPICLPRPSLKIEPSISIKFEIAGWGRQSYNGQSSDKLRSATLEIIPNQQCNKSYVSLKSPSLPEGIRSDQICAGTQEGDKDSCQGDSGGPLTMKAPADNDFDHDVHYQVGLVSFGRGCADKDYPGVYTRIIDYVPWIEKQLKQQTERTIF